LANVTIQLASGSLVYKISVVLPNPHLHVCSEVIAGGDESCSESPRRFEDITDRYRSAWLNPSQIAQTCDIMDFGRDLV
jgi:predicted nucleic acid-binding Zn ribbon protein